MNFKTIIIVMGILLPVLSIRAQSIKPLSIGDTVPNIVLHNVINYKDSVIRLSDFKDKLVILDFWATWCGPCYQAIMKNDSLSEKYLNNVIFILSSKENKQTVERFLNKNHLLKSQMLVLHNDSLLPKFFPHSLLPHNIWINQNRVLHSSSSNEVSTQNIQKVLKKIPIHMEEKIDYIGWDKSQSVLSDIALFNDSAITIKWTPKIDGLFSGGGVRKRNGRKYRLFLNTQIHRIYGFTIGSNSPNMFINQPFGEEKICLEVSYPDSKSEVMIKKIMRNLILDMYQKQNRKNDY